MQQVMFTKMWKRIGGCSVEETGEYLRDLGFDGADLTVRDGGHVAPGAVRERLPEAVETLDSLGLSVPMITTSITNADDEHAEAIFETASEQGVEFLKLGYWGYDGFGSMTEQLDAMGRDLDDVCKLSRRYDVTPAVHIHSHDVLSSNPAVLWDLLRDYDPDHVGAYLDPGHMALEGAGSGWEMGMDLLQDYTKMVAVKDFGLVQEPQIGRRDSEWTSRAMPLDSGLAPWPEVFECLDQMDFDGPLSIHGEYHVDDVDVLYDQTELDLEYLDTVR
ncbi:sugar phosphate isomerase/epimerase family protein [Halosimplex amylolyticum]|uniref:sugar phosphate isomerase/epimerase family protein n=1 Tax=Halosimplex amylolyticum TaxID=3396616 RepID=UPI003F547F0C